MSDRPFDREIENPLEKPLADDLNVEFSYSDRALREVVDRLFNVRTSISNDANQSNPPTGFFGDGFKARASAPAAMAVNLAAGLGFFGDVADLVQAIGGIVGVDDLQRYHPLVLLNPSSQLAPETLTVPAAPVAPNSRIDIVEVKVRRGLIDPTSREIFDTGSGGFLPGTVDKTLTFALNGQVGYVAAPANSVNPLGYKTGVPGLVPVAPAVSPGYVKICEITVGSGVVVINQTNIADFRKILYPYGQGRVAVQVSVNTTTGAPTILGLSAPPGVEVTVAAGGSAPHAQFDLFVTTGAPPSKIVAHHPEIQPDAAWLGSGLIFALTKYTLQGLLPHGFFLRPLANTIVGNSAVPLMASPPNPALAAPSIWDIVVDFVYQEGIMTRALIQINGVDSPDPSSLDLPAGTLVQLNNNGNGGELTYLWSILYQPPGPADSLSASNIQNPTFTPNKEGSYRIQLIVNLSLGDEQQDIAIAAVLQVRSGLRVIAFDEQLEANSSTGWAETAANPQARLLDALFADPTVVVGLADGIVSTGDTCLPTATSTILTGLPGESTLLQFTRVDATMVEGLFQTIYLCEGGVNGDVTPSAGQPTRFRLFGLVSAPGGGVVGDPVYLSDAGDLDLTPGTAPRVLGTIVALAPDLASFDGTLPSRAVLELEDGTGVGLSNGGQARIRYDAGGPALEASLNGGAYVSLMSASGNAPANAPYLTNGSVTGLSAEVNIQNIASVLAFIVDASAGGRFVVQAKDAGDDALSVMEIRDHTGGLSASIAGNGAFDVQTLIVEGITQLGDNIDGQTIAKGVNFVDPTAAQDLATKNYVDNQPSRTVTAASVTVLLTDNLFLADASANAVTLHLPALSTARGRTFFVKILDDSNAVTLDPDGAETIDGAGTYVFPSGASNEVCLQIRAPSTGTDWKLIGIYVPGLF